MKDPYSWENLISETKAILESTVATGAVLAFIMSFLQSIKNGAKKSCSQKVAEALTCSCISIVTIPLAESLALKIPYLQDFSFVGSFVGVFIGYMGSEQIKGWIVKRVEKKAKLNE